MFEKSGVFYFDFNYIVILIYEYLGDDIGCFEVRKKRLEL